MHVVLLCCVGQCLLDLCSISGLYNFVNWLYILLSLTTMPPHFLAVRSLQPCSALIHHQFQKLLSALTYGLVKS